MKSEILYSAPQWQSVLSANQLTTFEQFWDLELEALDEGNVGKTAGVWSASTPLTTHAVANARW